jgi:hypothetical protein
MCGMSVFFWTTTPVQGSFLCAMPTSGASFRVSGLRYLESKKFCPLQTHETDLTTETGTGVTKKQQTAENEKRRELRSQGNHCGTEGNDGRSSPSHEESYISRERR